LGASCASPSFVRLRLCDLLERSLLLVRWSQRMPLSAAAAGDAAHTFVMANTVAFMAAVVLQALQAIDLFSASWVVDGFCIAHKEASVPISGISFPLSSHALCFYSDTVTAALLLLLSRSRSEEAGMKPVATAGPGIFGHGAAHLGLWAAGVKPGGPPLLAPGASRLALLGGAVGVSAFFFLLFRSTAISARAAAVQSILHGCVTALLVPPQFGFTYVQTALMLVFSLAEVRRPFSEKDVYYAAYALLVSVPVGFVGWTESLGCDTFVRSIGGHLIYDTSISITICIYLALVRSGLLERAHKAKSM